MRENSDKPNVHRVLSLVKEYLPYGLIVFCAVFILGYMMNVAFSLNNISDVIVTEAANGAHDEVEAMHVGMMFNRIENCHFKAMDEEGNMVFGDDDYPLFVTNQTEVEIDGVHYMYAMNCFWIYILILAACLVVLVPTAIVMMHVHNVIKFNMTSQEQLTILEMCEEGMVSKEIRKLRREYFNKDIVKKLFNWVYVFVIPVIVFVGGIILTSEYARDIGLLVTDAVGGVIQHNGVMHEGSMVDGFTATGDITIEEIHADPQRIPPIVVGGGFHIEDNSAISYKALTNGNVCRITYDIEIYTHAFVPIFCMGIAYSIYFVIMQQRNNDIPFVSANERD